MTKHKIPPQSIEAEEAVLGALLIEPIAFNKVLEILRADDFYSPANRRIFRCVLDLYDKGEPCDMLTVNNALQERGDLDKIGGSAYIAKLVDSVPSAANVDYYAKIIKQKSVLRELISAAGDIIEKSFSGASSEVDDIIDEAQQAIFAISETRDTRSLLNFADVLSVAMKSIENLIDRREMITGVPTGFEKIDELTTGFQNSDLIIIAARPSMGKTAFALDIARQASCNYGKSVAIFSLEMSKEQLAMRMLSAAGKVDSQRIRKGLLSTEEWQRIIASTGKLYDAHIYIDDTPAISVLEMKAKARRLASEKPLDMVIIDYLQLMRGSAGKESREQEISEISRSLKALAKELNVPVVALSQMNRKVEERKSPIPQLSDLRESGAIEQDADVIMFIYRPEIYNRARKEEYDPDNDPDRGIAVITIEKQRNGPTGTVRLFFQQEYTSFESITSSFS